MLDRAGLGGLDGAQTVDRCAQCIDRAADQGITDADICRTSGTANDRTFVQAGLGAEQDNTHAVALQIEHDAACTGVKLDQLAIYRLVQAVNRGDTVTDLQHNTGLAALGSCIIRLDFFLQNRDNLFGRIQFLSPL